MKVLVKAYLAENLGDDLFLKILAERYPNVHFYLLDNNGQGICARYLTFHLKSFLLKVFNRILLHFDQRIAFKFSKYFIDKKIKKYSSRFDAGIILGGSMFIQNTRGFSFGDIVNISMVENLSHVFVIGANFGPYIEGQYISKYIDIFRQCDGISLRDKFSYELLGKLPNSDYFPDFVFQLGHEIKQRIHNSVGISVIDLTHRKDLSSKDEAYLNFLMSLIDTLIRNGKSIYLFSFCEKEKDENTINRILENGYNDSIRVIKYNNDIDSFLNIYGSMEAMFCSRFHSMILSLSFSQYMIPLVYSKKMTQALDDIGYTGVVVDLENLLNVSVDDVINALYSHQIKLPDNIRQRSKSMLDRFDSFLLEHKVQ